MRCHVCGGRMKETVSDMPFKLDRTRIVIMRDLPVLQCGECGEHAFRDDVMARVDEALKKVDRTAELEIVRYAA